MTIIQGKIFLAVSVSLALSACAASQKPILYPNDHYKDVGRTQAEDELNECLALADDYVKDPSKYQAMAEAGVVSGAIGAGAGALTGVIVGGSVGRSTGAGAAVGAIVAIAHELIKSGDRTPSYKNFVEHCLLKKGYEVTGWQ